MTESDSSSFTQLTPENQIPSIPMLPQNHPISTKLSEENYLIWRQQILATVRGYGLEPYLMGEQEVPPQMIAVTGSTTMVPNPSFLDWYRQDQRLAAWLQSSLADSVMVIVVGLTTSREIWSALETNFASQSKAKIMNYKLQLQTAKKDSLTMSEYLNKIKTLCDMLGSAGCRVMEVDHILHILSGLGAEYNPVMVVITSKGETWSVQDVAALLLNFESRLEATKSSIINMDGSQPFAHLSHAPAEKQEIHPNRNGSNYNRGEGS